MPNINPFAKNAIFVSKEKSKEKIFKAVYQDLVEKGYAQGDFYQDILSRENNFPTGLSLKTLGPSLPNIAVPHIEGVFVKKSLIVPVAIKYPVTFNNLIDENQNFSVKFLFMLLDATPDGQAKLFSAVLDFLANTSQDELKYLFEMDNAEEIYKFLSEKF